MIYMANSVANAEPQTYGVLSTHEEGGSLSAQDMQSGYAGGML